MRKNILIFVYIFTTLHADSFCALENNKYLNIACTKKCPNTYIKALKNSAKELHYKIRIKTLNQNRSDYKKLLSEYDGVLSPGGQDILPKYFTKGLSKKDKENVVSLYKKFGKTNANAKRRDKFEYNLFTYYFKHKEFRHLPILGVCYGMQMLASVNNIPLYVDIKEEIGVPARRKVYDKITLTNSNTSFIRYLEFDGLNKSLIGYKNHHQAIDLRYFNKMKKKGLYKNIDISGVSNSGKIPEIIEFKKRPVIGIQFHAERSGEYTRKKIYDYFLINACLNKIGHKNKN